MPLVRIDVPNTLPESERRAISEIVHESMVETFNVPLHDRFQIISNHAVDQMVCPSEFLGIHHQPHFIVVQITCAPGRTTEMKKALYSRIAQTVGEKTTIRAEDVIINLVESARENWSFGNGIAPFAQS
jgi:4-oxalocrotonate tautomerase